MVVDAVRVHVGIGSNLGEREARVEAACRAMAPLAVDAVRCSPLYESEPMGPSDQPDYVNAVCTFLSTHAPHELLAELQRIEREAGRVRPAARWSARTLDLDLLLYGERVLDTPDLVIPHPGIAERAFVLRPLADLEPALVVPGRGRVDELLAALGESGTRPLGAV